MVSKQPADGVTGESASRVRPAAITSAESWKRFLVDKPAYAPQYAQIYFCRLASLRPHVRSTAEGAWKGDADAPHFAERVLAAAGPTDRDSAVVGVVYRDLPAKPSVLAEYASTTMELIPAPPARTLFPYLSETDGGTVCMEDETGRLTLNVSAVKPVFDKLATGIIVAVRGREDFKTGDYVVSGVMSVGLAPQPSLPELASDRYVCIVSGLGLGSVEACPVGVEMLLEYLRSNIGNGEEEEFSANIVHLIVAGNTVVPPSEAAISTAASSAIKKPHNPVGKPALLDLCAPMVLADRFLTAVAAAIPVSVMPGEHDPANVLLPQQPLHRSLLPNSSREANLQCVTNPFELEVDGRVILGTSGQNVDDYVLYNASSARASASVDISRKEEADVTSKNEQSESLVIKIGEMEVDSSAPADSPAVKPENVSKKLSSADVALSVLETMMSNRHIAPTAPDTLGAYPFYNSDPFVVEKSPHVFFAGNQPEFGMRWHGVSGSMNKVNAKKGATAEKVCLLSVPRFDASDTAVLVNLRTMDCTTVAFSESLVA